MTATSSGVNSNVLIIDPDILELFNDTELVNATIKLGYKVSDVYQYAEMKRGQGETLEEIRQRLIEMAETQAELDGEPKPLPTHSVSALRLEPELIPPPLRRWLVDIADRMQCPLDYPAAAAIVAAGVLIGNKIAIRPKRFDDWLVIPNLFGGIVGPPGCLKSPAAGEALRPLMEIAKSERAQHEFETLEFGASKEVAEVEKRKAKQDFASGKFGRDEFVRKFEEAEVESPVERRIYTSDATVEKLGELLNQNPPGLLQLRDELTGWLRGLDRAGHEQDRAFFLEAWNGAGAFTFDRISRGTIHIKNLTLSVFGSIQPAMIGPYLRNAAETDGADGLIQRFQLLVYPEAGKSYQYVDRTPEGHAAVLANFKRLYRLVPSEINARNLGDQPFVSFDSSAQAFFETWFTAHEKLLRSGEIEDPAVLSHLAKYRSLLPTLALIFHLLDEKNTGDVGLEPTQRAAAWCDYLRSHAEKLYSLRGTVFDTAKLILRRIEKGDISDHFAARDVYRPCWSGLSKAEDVLAALSVLVDHGFLYAVQADTGGRSQTRFSFHPSLLKGGRSS